VEQPQFVNRQRFKVALPHNGDPQSWPDRNAIVKSKNTRKEWWNNGPSMKIGRNPFLLCNASPALLGSTVPLASGLFFASTTPQLSGGIFSLPKQKQKKWFWTTSTIALNQLPGF
jgi:hypothetical protein